MPAEALAAAAGDGFRARFGEDPAGVAFAPGRVNLIGEHVDYCGLPVLPAALPQGLALAFRPRTDDRVVCWSDLDPAASADFRFGEGRPDGFGRYLYAAGAAVRELGSVAGPAGFDGHLASDLPAAAGLSSSSALVVAAALAILDANDAPRPDRRRLALELARAERSVAIQGGAMDQSVILGAVPGHALHIAFEPSRWSPVPVDAERFAFLAVFTGRRAEKGGAAGEVFDGRVREANAALAGLQELLSDPAPWSVLLARRRFADLLAAAGDLPSPLDRRARHILTEARRTSEAVEALGGGDAGRLGALLDASHESLRRDYQVSAPELDGLVAAAREHGALGARLTGAGLGGSAVVLTTPAQAPAVAGALRERYPAVLKATPSAPARLIGSPSSRPGA